MLISFLCFSQLQAQLWPGSLSIPVMKVDFGLGSVRGTAVGTSTNYVYSPSWELVGENQYTIANSTSGLSSAAWHITSDHTGDPNGYGYMMIANSSSEVGDKVLYTKKVSGLCSDTTYELTAWIMNLMSSTSSYPNITFTVTSANGIPLGSYKRGEIGSTSSPEWKQYGFCFFTGSETNVIITIINSAPSSALALDDITLSACGPFVNTAIENESSTNIHVCRSSSKTCRLLGTIGYISLNDINIPTDYSNPAYQWQTSLNGITWFDISGVDARKIDFYFYPNTFGLFRYRMSMAQQGAIGSQSCRIYSNEIIIVVDERPDPATVETIQPSCDLLTGTITVTYPTNSTYSIDRVNYQSSPVFSGLVGRNYTIYIKETMDCAFSPVTARINSVPMSSIIPTADVIQPLNCTNPLGTITIKSLDYEYSFDNGASWTTNNIKSGIVAGEYWIKTRSRSNCETTAVSVSVLVSPDSPLTPTVTIIQPDCFIRTGTITVSDVAAEYSFDNGLTWTTSNSKSNLVAGKYKVLLKNTIGCISYVANEVEIKAYKNTEPLPVTTTPQLFCIQQNATFNDITISGTNLKWYDAAVNGNLLPATTILQSGTYYATQTVSVCESERIPVEIKIQNTPAPTGDAVQNFCTTQKPIIATLAAIGTNLKWYNSATNGIVFPTSKALTNGLTYYATQTVNGCESVNRLAVFVSIVTPSIAVNNVSDIICDDKNNGSELVDLTSYQSRITPNTTVTFTYFSSLSGAENQITTEQIKAATTYSLSLGTTTIYARIDSNDKCYQVVRLSLVSKPIIPISDSVILCESKDVTINAGSGFDSYLWSTGATSESIIVDTVGSYSVTVTQNHGNIICSSIKSFSVVLSNVATISEITIQDWTDADNVIIVQLTNSSIGDYEYSLDGIDFQDSNIFSGLRSGDYIVYVRDKNNCGTVNQEVFLLSYPKYFTPNADGYNDTWSVKFSELEPGLNTKIFNRYGKLIKELNATSSWDGTFNGRELPSADYWFVITRANGKVSKGHFAMKR